MLLQTSNDIEQIRRRRIALGPEHLVQRLAMNSRLLRQRRITDRRVCQNPACRAPL